MREFVKVSTSLLDSQTVTDVTPLLVLSVDAAAALASKAVGHQLDPADAKRLLRKIDRNLLPLMMVLYAMQFIDKTTLGNSSILGIKTDTHLTTTQYNLLG